MAKLQSHNTALTNSYRQLLMPSWPQVFTLLLVAGLALAIMNLGALWTLVNTSAGVSAQTADQVVSERFDRFSDFTGKLFEGRLGPMLFWAFLGVLTYMLIWLIQNAKTNVQNDLTARDFQHPWTVNRQRYWRSILSPKIFLVCISAFAAAFFYMAVAYWLPILARLFYAAIYSWQPLLSLWRLSIAISLMALLLYVAWLLWRSTKYAWHSVASNL